MLSSAQTLAPKPAQPPAAPPAAPANAAPAAGGPSFAQFLTEQAPPQVPAPAPAQADAEPAAPESGAEQARSAKASATVRRNAQPPAKPAAQNQNRANEAMPKAEARTTPADATEPRAEAVAADADEDDSPATPELKEFTQLLGMAPSQPEAAAAKPDLHHPRAAAADDAAERRADRRVAADAGRAVDTAEAAHAKAAEPHADKATPRATASEPLQAMASQSETAHAPAASAVTAPPSFAAALAQALPTPGAPADSAPTPTYAGVQSPLHSPAFAPELGARVSLLAIDGIQQAELQLNPADMGPVAVQIVVDGSQAQVSFHAVQAETRQALEQSLPDLAAALQGQGLTLSGGGVFQQAARDADHGQDERGSNGSGRGSRGGSERVGGTTTATAAPTRRTVGLLDTFA